MTILGQHTVAETRDLMRVSEFRINKNQQQLARIQAQRLHTVPISPEQAQLDSDMATFIRRWTDVRDTQAVQLAASITANPGVHPAILPSEAQYVAIDNAVRRDDPRLVTIEQRIDKEAASLGLPPTDLSKTPPQNSPDADFAALRKLDAAIAAGEASVKETAKSNVGLIVGALALAVVGTVVVTKVYL